MQGYPGYNDGSILSLNLDTRAHPDTQLSSDKTLKRNKHYMATLQWILENYETSEGACVPRSAIYQQYLQFCREKDLSSSGPAAFGKILRHRFPGLSTRRLGTRGQSKYHYYGIDLKKTSSLSMISKPSASTRFGESGNSDQGDLENEKAKVNVLLGVFPDPEDFMTSNVVTTEMIRTFLVMYRTHSQRMLDMVTSASFVEVRRFMEHFWRGVPNHLADLLYDSLLADLVAVCDIVLYKAMEEVLIPCKIHDVPESFKTEIETFLRQIPNWIKMALKGLPETLLSKKIQVVKRFVQRLRRQLQFLYVAQACRSVLVSSEKCRQVRSDLMRLDLTEICHRFLYLNQSIDDQSHLSGESLNTYFLDLLSVLDGHPCSVESVITWATNIFQAYVDKNSRESLMCTRPFFLSWHYFLSLISRDLTLKNAYSFGFCQLLLLLLEEYALLTAQVSLDKIENAVCLNSLQRYCVSEAVSKKLEQRMFSHNRRHWFRKIFNTVDNSALDTAQTAASTSISTDYPKEDLVIYEDGENRWTLLRNL